MARAGRRRAVYLVLLAALTLVAAAAMLLGRAELDDRDLRAALLQLRLARFAAAFIAGAALAVGGVMVQGLFRNPLASPSILGTTAGASLGGRLSLLVFEAVAVDATRVLVPEMLLPLGCVLGALLSLGVLLLVARQRDDIIVLLLTGFLLSSLFISLGGFVTSLAQERWELARAMISFALGDVSATGLRQIALATPLLLGGALAAWLWARPLDVLLSGEEEARSLGVNVPAVRRWVVVWTAMLTAAAVAIGGNVGFVGLVVPHALRPFVGVTHRSLVPAAALAGGTFLATCDVISRAVPSTTEIPLGVVTGLLGAPTFLFLLIRSRRELAHVA